MAAPDATIEDRSHGDPLELPALCPRRDGGLEALSGLAPRCRRRSAFPASSSRTGTTRRSRGSANSSNGSRALRVYLDSCVKCGACTDKCHYFLGTGDPKNMPVARQDLLRKVYRRHFTLGRQICSPGWSAPRTSPRRCSPTGTATSTSARSAAAARCSARYGIDTAEISMAARDIMDTIGLGQKYSNEIIGKVFKIGNNLGLPPKALKNTLEGLEDDIEEETGVRVELPLDREGADILLVTPSADFFASPHMEGLIGYAKVLHEAGVSWTFSSYASEAANFGMFIGSYDNMQKVALRIRKAAEDLRVKRLVFGECGHAWRVAYSFLEHPRRAARLPRPGLSHPAAHLRVHARPDREGQAAVRQVEERRTSA